MYHSYSTLFPQHFLPPFMAPLSRVFHTLIWSTTVYPHQFFPPSSPHPHAPIPPSTPHSQNNLSSSSHPHGTYSSLNCIPSWHIFLPQLHTLMTSISTSTLHPHGTYSSLNSTPSWHIFLPQLYTLMAPILPSTPHPHGTDSFHYSTPSSHLWSIPACCHLYANLSPLHQAGDGQGQAPRVHCLVNNTDTGDTDTRDTDTGDTDTRVIDAGDSQIHEIRVHRYRRYS